MTNAKNGRIQGLLLCLILLLASVRLYAANYEQGKEAYLAENYHEAVRIWRALADDGDPRAQFSLGQMYLEGLGAEQDDAESTRWFRMAALQGLAPAQFNLGNAYKHGRGVQQDDFTAALWWQRAAEQNLAPAQFNLAMLYTYGRGVPKDEDQALSWYRRAAANGHPEAMRILDTLAGTGFTEEVKAVALPAGATAREQRAVSAGFNRESWLLAQDSLHYTVQVIASHTEASLISALSKHELAGPLAYFGFSRHGEPWYAAVYGVFATHSEAQAAADRLPRELRKNAPWIRQFGAVQALIRKP